MRKVKAQTDKKKDTRFLLLAREMKTKTANPATKMSEMMCGHIQKRRVRCGKQNCKCMSGETHTAFYNIWHTNGRRCQKYVRKSQVETLRKSCAQYRQLQIQLRAGRKEYKQLFARARMFLRSLS